MHAFTNSTINKSEVSQRYLLILLIDIKILNLKVPTLHINYINIHQNKTKKYLSSSEKLQCCDAK